MWNIELLLLVFIVMKTKSLIAHPYYKLIIGPYLFHKFLYSVGKNK